MKRLALLSLFTLLAASASAGEILIPVAVRAPGAFNTLWRTEIVVANVSTDPQQMDPVHTTITFHRDNGETEDIDLHLARQEVYAVHDAVFEWFSVATGSGIVRVTWDDPNARITARARIYNVGEHGEYGQSVPGVETNKLVTQHFLPGLTGVDGNRTNVGVSNPSDTATLFWVELFDTSGLSRGAFQTSVGPRSYRQFNDIFEHFQAGPLNAAMIRIQSMNAPLYAYASVVRNDTGDATFVMQQ